MSGFCREPRARWIMKTEDDVSSIILQHLPNPHHGCISYLKAKTQRVILHQVTCWNANRDWKILSLEPDPFQSKRVWFSFQALRLCPKPHLRLHELLSLPSAFYVGYACELLYSGTNVLDSTELSTFWIHSGGEFQQGAIAEISILGKRARSMKVAASLFLPRCPEMSEITFIWLKKSNPSSGAWEVRYFRVDLFFQLHPFPQNGYEPIQGVLCSDNVTDECYWPWLLEAFVPKWSDLMRSGPEVRRTGALWTPWQYRYL